MSSNNRRVNQDAAQSDNKAKVDRVVDESLHNLQSTRLVTLKRIVTWKALFFVVFIAGAVTALAFATDVLTVSRGQENLITNQASHSFETASGEVLGVFYSNTVTTNIVTDIPTPPTPTPTPPPTPTPTPPPTPSPPPTPDPIPTPPPTPPIPPKPDPTPSPPTPPTPPLPIPDPIPTPIPTPVPPTPQPTPDPVPTPQPSGSIPANYTGLFQFSAINPSTGEVVASETVHTSRIIQSTSELNKHIAPGTYTVIFVVAEHGTETVSNVSIPIKKLTDSSWPQFIQNAVYNTGSLEGASREDETNIFRRYFQQLFSR